MLEVFGAVAGIRTTGDEDYVVTTTMPARRDWLQLHHISPRTCYVIRIRGPSMEPTLLDGTALIVDSSRRKLRDGHIYLVRARDGLVVKRVRRNVQGWWLLSDNPLWPPLMLAENTLILGEVRWAGVTFMDSERRGRGRMPPKHEML